MAFCGYSRCLVGHSHGALKGFCCCVVLRGCQGISGALPWHSVAMVI